MSIRDANPGDTISCEVCLSNGAEQPAKTILGGSSVCLTHWYIAKRRIVGEGIKVIVRNRR